MNLPGILIRAEERFNGKQSHSIFRTAGLASQWIQNSSSQHLEAAADPDQKGSAGLVPDAGFHTRFAEPAKVADRVFGPGQDDQVGLSQ